MSYFKNFDLNKLREEKADKLKERTENIKNQTIEATKNATKNTSKTLKAIDKSVIKTRKAVGKAVVESSNNYLSSLLYFILYPLICCCKCQTLRNRKNAFWKPITDRLSCCKLKSFLYWFAIFTGLLIFILAYNLLLNTMHLMQPRCPYIHGRQCNGRGECIEGLCVCETLFSGEVCTDNQILDYDLLTNTECNNKGFAFPFIQTPPQCENNWNNSECNAYVTSIRAQIKAKGGNASLVPLATTIPNCICQGGWLGEKCEIAACPRSADGYVCGSNGNRSIGLFYNYTSEESLGCQCLNPFLLTSDSNLVYFNTTGLFDIQDFYYTEFNQLYCGHIANISGVSNVLTVYTLPTDYKCFCNDDWTGTTCDEGICPFNRITKEICYGQGHPLKGQGYLANTTLSTHRGKTCQLHCTDGFETCGKDTNKCVYTQDRENPLFVRSQYCANPISCPAITPVRCATGGCVELPPVEGLSGNCLTGFRDGVIDFANLNVSLSEFVCSNITNQLSLEVCLQNETSLDSVILGYNLNDTWTRNTTNIYSPQRPGFYFNSTNGTLTLDYGSPLVYFEMVTNASFVQVKTWDNQYQTFSETGFISGFFSYVSEGKWQLSVLDEFLEVFPKDDPYNLNLYKIGPMRTWNYTGEGNIQNDSYSFIKTVAYNQQYVFAAQTSYLNIFPFDNFGERYLLVQLPTDNQTQIQNLWLHPNLDGTILTQSAVPQEICLSNPSYCSWFLDDVNTQIRNLALTKYICTDMVTLFTQVDPCQYVFTDYIGLFTDYLWYWNTFIIAESDTSVSLNTNLFYEVYLNNTERTSWPFEISFTTPNQTADPVVFIENPTFLTLNRITYPCVCDFSPGVKNMTVLNNNWWNEPVQRFVDIDLVSYPDKVLVGVVVEGELNLVRGTIQEVNTISGTVVVEAHKTGQIINAYVNNTRAISNIELLSGNSDYPEILFPFKCPDGTQSTASSYLVDINVGCNCTFATPITNCSCWDPLPSYFGCQCNSTATRCECGLPATPDFALRLWDKVDSLTVDGCYCLLYTPTEEELAQIELTNYDINEASTIFNFSINQVPLKIVIKYIDDYPISPDVTVIGSSELFSNVTIEFFTYNSLNTANEQWITLFIDENYAFSQIIVTDNSGNLFNWATLIFSEHGYSLYPMLAAQSNSSGEFAFTGLPSIFASSNSDDASIVGIDANGTYWLSSGVLSEVPVWIEMKFQRQIYVDYARVTFYKAGTKIGITEIPQVIWLQASSSSSRKWYTIGYFGVYLEEGGWKTLNLQFNLTETYDRFRLISRSGQFGVRQWQMYANQNCLCEDGSHLEIKFTNYSGLPTLESQIEGINYFNEHISPNNCIFENECILQISEGIFKDFANDGQCQDLIYTAFLLGIEIESVIIDTTTETINATSYIYTELTSDLNAVQFLVNSTTDLTYLNSSELLDLYNTLSFYSSFPGSSQNLVNYNPYFIPNVTNDAIQIYFLSGNLQVLNIVETTYYVLNSYEFITYIYANEYIGSPFLTSNFTCPAGFDGNDCGPSTRNLPLMTGYSCQLNPVQQTVQNLILNGTILTNNTYLITNLTSFSHYWTANYQNISLTRRISQIQLNDCPGQVCAKETPYMCEDGKCKQFKTECKNFYTCPGNGCVQLTDASLVGNDVFSCACAAGFGGSGCEFGECKPAFPENEFSVNAAQECTCGAPPPLREKQPAVLGLYRGGLTLSDINEINNRVTSGSAPKSTLDVDYLRIMPLHAPFGLALKYKFVINEMSESLTPIQRTIWTSCPPAMEGENGEYLLLPDVVLSRNIFTGEVTEWRTITKNGQTPQTYPWLSITQWNDFPYRCRNGQCVKNRSFCAESELLYPLCNGKGTCRADGSCDCFPGFRTFSISETYTLSITYPYAVINGIPDPTVWELNWNWKNHGLNQCTARNCNETDCSVPIGCYPGTKNLNFANRLLFCPPSTGRDNLCGTSNSDCLNGINLTPPLVCSGNGIKRIKDFTNEEYCACGKPISTKMTIGQVTQLTQLIPNGWGGRGCDVYAAPESPVLWSPWNWELNEPWRSTVTGEVLPGKWISGIRIMGAKPEDIADWRKCCQNIDRLESCSYVPCKYKGTLYCEESAKCRLPDHTPLVYPCNGHGLARADGTCECDVDVEGGTGYTFDFSEYSQKGCYKQVACPNSAISGVSCNFVSSCSNPGEWRYPISYDVYLEQQWFTCGVEGIGEYSNATILNNVMVDINDYEDKVMQSLSTIALQVLQEEADLNACICVYPDDTIDSKCCMVGDGFFVYNTSFISPYLIYGEIIGYPTLTDNILSETIDDTYQNKVIPKNTTLLFNVFEQTGKADQVLVIQAIRMYGTYPPTFSNITRQIEFFTELPTTSPTTVSICSTPDFIYPNPLGSTNVLDWNLGTLGDAYYCAPSYECVDLTSDIYSNDYSYNCDQDVDSVKCKFWKRTTCQNIALGVYWPSDSPNVYVGCNRDDVSSGCNCCKIIETPTFSVINNQIQIQTPLLSDIILGEVRFYGYFDVILQQPEWLLKGKGNNPLCHDEAYMFQNLGVEHGLYVPKFENTSQFIVNRNEALNRCNQTGGFLAVALNLKYTSEDEYFGDMTTQCSEKNTGVQNPTCWVNAKNNLYKNTVTTRNYLFNSSCTTYGCFSDDIYVNSSIINLFSVKNDTQYQSPYFSPNQVTLAEAYSLNISFPNLVYPKIYVPDPFPKDFGQTCQIEIIYDSDNPTATGYPEGAYTFGTSPIFGNTVNANAAKILPNYCTSSNWNCGPTVSFLCKKTFSFQLNGKPFFSTDAPSEVNFGYEKDLQNEYWDDCYAKFPQPNSGWTPGAYQSNNWNETVNFVKTNNKIFNFAPFTTSGTDSAYITYKQNNCEPNLGTRVVFSIGHLSNGKCVAGYKSLDLVCEFSEPEWPVYGPMCASYNIKNNFKYFSTINKVKISPPGCASINFYAPGGNNPTNPSMSSLVYSEHKVGTDPNRGYLQNLGNNAEGVSSDYGFIGPYGSTYSYYPNFNPNYLVPSATNGFNYYYRTPSILRSFGSADVPRNWRFCRVAYELTVPNFATKTQTYCEFTLMKILPGFTSYFQLVEIDVSRNQKFTNGIALKNKTLGYDLYPYKPFIIYGRCVGVVSNAVSFTKIDNCIQASTYVWTSSYPSYNYGILPNRFLNNIVYFQNYFVQTTYTTNTLIIQNLTSLIKFCSECALPLQLSYDWDTLIYRNYLAWPSNFGPYDYLNTSVYLKIKDVSTPQWSLLTSFNNPISFTDLSIFTYQTVFLDLESISNWTYVMWDLPTCIVVNNKIASTSLCSEEITHNYVCMYDYIKYATPTGYQCDECGPNVRIGGYALPGETCQDSFPLTNVTRFPTENLIKDQYLAGTLDVFAQSFNLQANDTNFDNVSVLFAFPKAWDSWKKGFSTRLGQTSPKGTASKLNWCDLNLRGIWPTDCGIQRNPLTNVIERYCATNTFACNLDFEIGDNPIMKQSDVPPLLGNVSEDVSTVNPSCGYNVFLNSYFTPDKYGGVQTDLDTYQNIIQLNDEFIKLEALDISVPLLWANFGKTTYKYVFQWNVTATITGKYQIIFCTGCSVIMEVMIYPLNPYYTYPSNVLSKNITLTADGVQRDWITTFEVTRDDTGIYYLNGEEFPLIAFKGIGFIIHGMTKSSIITLTAPLLTDPLSRDACETRPGVTWYEAKQRILSTAPLRRCVISEEDQLLFPNIPIGNCACDITSSSKTCDCIAVTSKYGKQTCGGFGNPVGRIITASGSIEQVGGEGCYIYEDVTTGEKIPECKVIDVGVLGYTYQVPSSLWNFPSIFVESVPKSNDPVFFIDQNLGFQYYDIEDMIAKCVETAASLIYFYTANELNQLVIEYAQVLPVFLNLYGELNGTDWVWNTSLNFYLMKDNQGVSIEIGSGNTDPDCTTYPEVCAAINFNNYAYQASITYTTSSPTSPTSAPVVTNSPTSPTTAPTANTGNAFLVNGEVLDTGTTEFGILTWDADLDFNVNILAFKRDSNTVIIECFAGGVCEDSTWDSNTLIQTYACRCPTRKIQILSGYQCSEIQIFSSVDLVRSTAYVY